MKLFFPTSTHYLLNFKSLKGFFTVVSTKLIWATLLPIEKVLSQKFQILSNIYKERQLCLHVRSINVYVLVLLKYINIVCHVSKDESNYTIYILLCQWIFTHVYIYSQNADLSRLWNYPPNSLAVWLLLCACSLRNKVEDSNTLKFVFYFLSHLESCLNTSLLHPVHLCRYVYRSYEDCSPLGKDMRIQTRIISVHGVIWNCVWLQGKGWQLFGSLMLKYEYPHLKLCVCVFILVKCSSKGMGKSGKFDFQESCWEVNKVFPSANTCLWNFTALQILCILWRWIR